MLIAEIMLMFEINLLILLLYNIEGKSERKIYVEN
jgi:hypothetical protein